MGIFDRVWVLCPHCGAKCEHQSKAADPYMNNYTLENAPACIQHDILNEPTYCSDCGMWHVLLHPNYPPGHDIQSRLDGILTAKVRTPKDSEIRISRSQSFLRWWDTDVTPFTMEDVED